MSTSIPGPVIPPRDIVLVDPDTGEELATVTASVVTVERKEEPGLLTYMASATQKEADPRHGYLVGLQARLQVVFPGNLKPDIYFLSRLRNESYWLQDAHFGPDGFPHFSHGFGARYLDKHGIHDALEALLDEAARTLGMAAEIGTGTPLVLAASSPDPGGRHPA